MLKQSVYTNGDRAESLAQGEIGSFYRKENRKSLESAAVSECEIKEILGHNTISINDYNLMDAMQKSILIEQNYVIIRMLNEILKK